MGILALLSGFGANITIMIKLIMLAIQRAESGKVIKEGSKVLNKIVTILQTVAVFK